VTRASAKSQNLTGNSANNVIQGSIKNDFLDGATGADTMRGGAANDSYAVDSKSDVVSENTSEGTDRVVTDLKGYTLAKNVKNLFGSATNDGQTLKGNDLNNRIEAGAGNDSVDLVATR
jgi:Ca2+-binding RTX toxin-like protein